MLHLRRSALRLLSSSRSAFLVPKSRTVSSFTSLPLRTQRVPKTFQFQRRWATGEAEAKKEGEEENAPISEIQATSQEEVENAIHEDNAAQSVEESRSAEAKADTEALATEAKEQSILASAAETVADTVKTVADSVIGGARQRNSTVLPSIGVPKKSVYIGNLFFDVTENDLVKELSRFGVVSKCRLLRDSRGLSKGFGYADFETLEGAKKAIEGLNQQLFEGRRLTVQYAAYSSEQLAARRPLLDRSGGPLNPPSKTLFIGNMHFDMTDRDLNDLFRGIRNIIDVRVAIDRRTGQPRGFAHADFTDVKSAMEAFKHLEQQVVYGRKLKVDYSYGPSNSPRGARPSEPATETPSD